MRFLYYLPANAYNGTIDGIEFEWKDNAKTYLRKDAARLKMDMASLKKATEHLAGDNAKRCNKPKIQILGSFHTTTTITATGDKIPAQCHCTFQTKPGKTKVHVYVDHTPTIPLNEMRVLKEIPVLNRSRPATAIKTYHRNENSELGLFDGEKEALSIVTPATLDTDIGNGL